MWLHHFAPSPPATSQPWSRIPAAPYPPQKLLLSVFWTLRLGKIEGRRRRRWQRMRLLDGITDSMHLSLSKLRDGERMGKPGVLLSVEWIRVGYDWLTITDHQSTLLIWQWGWLCFLIFSSFNYLWNHPGLYEQLILWPQYISDAKLLEIWLFIFMYFHSIFIRKH